MGTVHLIRAVRDPNSLPVIAIVAHEACHDELRAMCRAQRRLVARVRFIADVRTASTLAREIGTPVALVTDGAHSGLVKIGMSIAEHAVDAAIVLRAPAGDGGDPDLEFLIRLCDRYSVPAATNPATGTIVLETLTKTAVSAEAAASRWSRNRHPSVFAPRRFPWDRAPGSVGSVRRITMAFDAEPER